MRKRGRNPASKESSGLREKAKGGLSDRALALFNRDHFGSFHGSNRRGTGEIGRSLWIYPWQQPAENQKDRAITLDLNQLWIHRGGPTPEVERAEDARGDGEEVGWCKRGAALRHGRFPAQALVMIDEDNARGGARRHGCFPPLAVNRLNMKRYFVEPMPYHDRVAELCFQLQIPKAFGKAGGMLNKLRRIVDHLDRVVAGCC